MPAIHIDRLIQQIHTIFDPESPAPIFGKNFRALMEVHANLAYRAGTEIQRKSSIPKLHLPPIVLQQIQLQLTSLAQSNPDLALEYADQLWLEDSYEAKYFSAVILGALPVEFTTNIIDRFIDWGSKTPDKEIHEILFKYGSQNIIKSNSSLWFEMIQNWVDSTSVPQAITAIYALQTLVNDPGFINLPKIFKIITPLFSINNRKILTGLTQLVEDLALSNPNETAHYLSNLLLITSDSSPKQIIRKCLKIFPIEEQNRLRTALSNITDEN